jgi:hypothetical protein
MTGASNDLRRVCQFAQKGTDNREELDGADACQGGKGRKDRDIMLSPALLEALRAD